LVWKKIPANFSTGRHWCRQKVRRWVGQASTSPPALFTTTRDSWVTCRSDHSNFTISSNISRFFHHTSTDNNKASNRNRGKETVSLTEVSALNPGIEFKNNPQTSTICDVL
jgi:hypothetical protein